MPPFALRRSVAHTSSIATFLFSMVEACTGEDPILQGPGEPSTADAGTTSETGTPVTEAGADGGPTIETSRCASPDNLLTNGCFDLVARPWEPYANGTIVQLASPGFEGTSALHVTTTLADVSARQVIGTLPPRPDTCIRAGFSHKLATGEAQTVMLGFHPNNGTRALGLSATVSDAWANASIECRPGNDNWVDMIAELELHEPGDVLFDNAFVEYTTCSVTTKACPIE